MDDRQATEQYLSDLIRGLVSERDDQLAEIHAKYDKKLNFFKSALDLLDEMPEVIVPAFLPSEKVKVAVLDFPTDFPVDGLVGEKVNWAFDRLDTARIIEIYEEIKKVDPNPPSRGAVGTNINRRAKRGELKKVGKGQHDPYRRVKANTVQPRKPSATQSAAPNEEASVPLAPAAKWALQEVKRRGHVVDEIDREIFQGIEELGEDGQRIKIFRRMERMGVAATANQIGHRITKYIKYEILDSIKHPEHFLKNHYRITFHAAPAPRPPSDMFTTPQQSMTENGNADRQGEKIPGAEEPATTPRF